MAYLKGNVWYTRVRRLACSCKTHNATVATAMEGFIAGIEGRHDPLGVVAAIADKRVSIVDAYVQGEEATARKLKEQAAAKEAEASEIDLKPLFEEFMKWRLARNKKTTTVKRNYRSQMTKLFPEDRWLRSWFTPRVLTTRLEALDVSDPTRNRYRSPVSKFCEYLLNRHDGILEYNPAKMIEGYAENEPQVIWHDVKVAKAIVLALPPLYRAREALMAGAGLDWSDCARVRRRDIDLEARTISCQGSKTVHRRRVVRITEAWVLPILRPLLADLLPDAHVCAVVWPNAALREHDRASEIAGAGIETTLHQWRHHYAVTARRRGERIEVIARQLGHGDSALVQSTYGKYVPNESDYLPDEAEETAVPILATAPILEVHRAS